MLKFFTWLKSFFQKENVVTPNTTMPSPEPVITNPIPRDEHYVYRPLLDLIGYTEGTDKGDGYNETLNYGAYTGGNVTLTKMTLKQIDNLQTKMLKHPKNYMNSSAVGRYQIVRTTLRSIKKTTGLSDTELYNEDTQDKLARYLLWYRGIDKYIIGQLSENTMINNLAKEWASFPTTANKGYYGGQHAAVSSDVVRKKLKEVKNRALNNN